MQNDLQKMLQWNWKSKPADNAGKTFLDTLSASGMSEGEKLDALNRYIEERLNNGDNLSKIAQDIGLDYDSGFATGITDNTGMVEEAGKSGRSTSANQH